MDVATLEFRGFDDGMGMSRIVYMFGKEGDGCLIGMTENSCLARVHLSISSISSTCWTTRFLIEVRFWHSRVD